MPGAPGATRAPSGHPAPDQPVERGRRPHAPSGLRRRVRAQVGEAPAGLGEQGRVVGAVGDRGGEEGAERGAQGVRIRGGAQGGQGQGAAQRGPRPAPGGPGAVRAVRASVKKRSQARRGSSNGAGRGSPRSSAASAGAIQSTPSSPAAVRARRAAQRARPRWVAGHAASTASSSSRSSGTSPRASAPASRTRRLGSRPPQDRISARSRSVRAPGTVGSRARAQRCRCAALREVCRTTRSAVGGAGQNCSRYWPTGPASRTLADAAPAPPSMPRPQ